MALVEIRGPLYYPEPFYGIVTVGTATLLIDASGEKAAFIGRVPKTGDLEAFEFCLGAVTQAPTNGLKCSFQDVDLTTGDPDGTVDQSVVVTTGLTTDAWVAPGDFSATRAVARGDRLACVIEFESFAASDSVNIRLIDTRATAEMDFVNECYADLFTTSWAKQFLAGPRLALRYNDGSYVALLGNAYPYLNPDITVSVRSDTTPDEVGNIFQVPFTCAVGGCWVDMDLDSVCDIVLYDSDGASVLATASCDPDVRQTTVSRMTPLWFSTDVTLAVNTNYRLVVKPTTASFVTPKAFSVNTASLLDGFPMGQTMHRTERTDAGAWTETTTQRMYMGLVITKLDDGVSAGGGGGMRLAGHGGLAA